MTTQNDINALNFCSHYISISIGAHCNACISSMQWEMTSDKCKHNRPVKFGCSKCYFERFNEDKMKVKKEETICNCDCHDNRLGNCRKCCFEKQETITIKKSLWDEMLQYKKLIDKHEKYLKKIDSIALCDPYKVWENQKILQGEIDQLQKQENHQMNVNKEVSSKIDDIKCQLEILYDSVDMLRDHCVRLDSGLSKLEEKIIKLGEYIKMEDIITVSDVLLRLTKLEGENVRLHNECG